VDAVRALVELGANVNAQNNMTGATPLHMVAQSQKASPADRLEVIDLLISGGAAVDQADNYGHLPVQVVQVGAGESPPGAGTASPASAEDTHATLQTFIAKLQPERPDLYAAIAKRDLAFVQEQCAAQGASLTKLSFQGMLPLSFAVDEFLVACRTTGNPETKTSELETLLGIVQMLLRSGADVNGGISSDSSVNPATLLMGAGGADSKDPPLHRAICQIRETFKSNASNESVTQSSDILTLSSLITLFVDSGATVSDDTVLLLHQAARFNEVAFAQFLMDALHVDPNAKGRQGMTPLHFAARSGQVEMVVRFSLK
jgi:Ankyrin repeats (many copies)